MTKNDASRWYFAVSTAKDDDLAQIIAEAYSFFDAEYEESRAELDVDGKLIEAVAKRIPGNIEYRYGQLQVLEGIIANIEKREQVAQGKARKAFLEHYNRTLTERQIERYAEVDPKVIEMRELRELISLVRNKYLGVSKGFESMHYQLGNMVKLRAAGLDGAVL